MRTSLSVIVGFALSVFPIGHRGAAETPVSPLTDPGIARSAPLILDTDAAAPEETTETRAAPPKAAPKKVVIAHPTRLVIPSIALDAPVEHVGVNTKGEMDVPSGSSPNVGWYKYGTVPGRTGSAVIDAHVFAAFENLRYLKPGSDVYVITENGQKLHFVVADSRVYRLAELTPQMLFGKADAKRLNLITCAGMFVPKLATYDRRLVVYTTFVGLA